MTLNVHHVIFNKIHNANKSLSQGLSVYEQYNISRICIMASLFCFVFQKYLE